MIAETKTQSQSTFLAGGINRAAETPTNWRVRQAWDLAPAALIGLLIVLLYLALALFGEQIAPYPYTEQHFSDTLQPPSLVYPFGTDQFGRDIFSRVIVGSRSIIVLAGAATLLSLLLGVAIGLVAGYAGGLWDEAIMRATDVLLSFPALLLALLIISTLGSAMIYLILTIAIVFAPGIARVVRSEVLGLKGKEFIEAAHATGVSVRRIALRHLLPNLTGVIVVEGSIYFSYAILVGAGLGFLGLGVQPPSPDWGLQVNDGRNFILTAWWITVFPALAISSLVLGVNLLADGLAEGKTR
ncbi:MAG: ABC transporter permease [Caldilineaceae bacterium]